MDEIGFSIGAEPGKPVGPRIDAVGPEVRAPANKRRHDRTFRGIKVEVTESVDLICNGPFNSESSLVRERLRVMEGGGVSASASGEIGEFNVRIVALDVTDDRLEIGL